MDNTTRRNSIALGIIIVLAVAAFVLYKHSTEGVQVTIDPDSKQVIINDSDLHPEKTVNPDHKITISTSESLFNKGLTANEYQAMLRVFNDGVKNVYGDKYQYGAVKENSDAYNKNTDTYTFAVRLGKAGDSNPIINVSIRRVQYNILEVAIKDESGKTLTNRQEKVNLNL